LIYETHRTYLPANVLSSCVQLIYLPFYLPACVPTHAQVYDAAADGKQADPWGKTAFPARKQMFCCILVFSLMLNNYQYFDQAVRQERPPACNFLCHKLAAI
jgi:hypothetical protein